MNLRDLFTISTWWGKLLGAIFGYLIAGPAGAVFGIFVGNFFDRGLANHFSNPHYLYHAEKRKTVQKIFFEATFTIMGLIAKADGRVSENEIRSAELLMQEMKLNRQQKINAKRLFNEGKQEHFNVDSILNQLHQVCRENHELLQLFIETQYQLAQVDGLTANKIKILDLILTYLGFAPLNRQYRFYENFNSSSQQEERKSKREYHRPYTPQNNLAQAYAILEINPDSTKQEVKKAYRRLLSRNHPDKLIAQGLPEEMIKLANEKTHKIMKAYELICENKGW